MHFSVWLLFDILGDLVCLKVTDWEPCLLSAAVWADFMVVSAHSYSIDVPKSWLPFTDSDVVVPPPLISIDSSQSWHSAPLVVSQDLGTVCRCPSTLACNSHFCSSLEFLLNKHYQLCLITVQFYFISKFDGLVPLCQDSGRSKAALIPLSDASSSLLDMQIAAQGICLNAIYCSRLLVAHLLIKYVVSTSDSVLLQISV